MLTILKSFFYTNQTKFAFLGFTIFMACNTNTVPKNVILPNKMVNILVDMHLADAVLSSVRNQDTMLMMASSKYYYIFKKHQIDSAKFTQSLKYYNTQPNQFKEMYNQVVDSLNAKIPKEKKIKKMIKKKLF